MKAVTDTNIPPKSRGSIDTVKDVFAVINNKSVVDTPILAADSGQETQLSVPGNTANQSQVSKAFRFSHRLRLSKPLDEVEEPIPSTSTCDKLENTTTYSDLTEREGKNNQTREIAGKKLSKKSDDENKTNEVNPSSFQKQRYSRRKNKLEPSSDKAEQKHPSENATNISPGETETTNAVPIQEKQHSRLKVDSAEFSLSPDVSEKRELQPVTQQPRQSRRLRKKGSQPMEESCNINANPAKQAALKNGSQSAELATEDHCEMKQPAPQFVQLSEAQGSSTAGDKCDVEVKEALQNAPSEETKNKKGEKSDNMNQSIKAMKRVSFSVANSDLESVQPASVDDGIQVVEVVPKRSNRTRKQAVKEVQSDLSEHRVPSTNSQDENSESSVEMKMTEPKSRQSMKPKESVVNKARETHVVKRTSKSVINTSSESSNAEVEDISASQSKRRKSGRFEKPSDICKENYSSSEEQNLHPVAVGEVNETFDEDVSSQISTASEVEGRKSTRLRKQSNNSEDTSVSGKEIASKTAKSKQSSQEKLGVKATKSSRARQQQTQMNEETLAHGIKRLSNVSDPVILKGVVPGKVPRQSTNDFSSSRMQENVESTSTMDDSTTSFSLKGGGCLNDSFLSDASQDGKRRRGRLDSVASTCASPRRSQRQSLKPTSTPGCTHVLFTGYSNSRHESIVKQLGGVVIDAIECVDVLVTDKLRRTVKLLSTVGKGLPVVGPSWLTLSKNAGRLLDPWQHILSDKEAEDKFGIKLENALHKAVEKPLLEGYNIHITKNVKPVPDEMKAIIQSCGGKVLPRKPSAWPPNSVVISCQEDKASWNKMKGNVPIVAAEWLLSGVLTQELDMKTHLLKPS